MTKILVVDDDPHLREVVRYALARQGWTITEAADGLQAVAAARAEPPELPPDLIVMDVVMPELDGLEACRRIRQSGPPINTVPIVFLSSRDEELDRVLGLEMGGDDYLCKPFSPRELVSRIKAVLRRARPEPAQAGALSLILRCGALSLDPVLHRVHVTAPSAPGGATELTLTVTEFSILQVLMSHPGRAYTRDEITDRVYGEGHHLSDRTLDSHIRRIRQKCKDAAIDPVETVHGLGYRLNA